ncbi:phosphonate C-P lyase system protein PhnK [Rhizobium laguerreae]|uniref:phosphonate C-P lyase system protein PhnK n=1 Tax=Rhizobium laguerreae TaxID=1076926 RepID=UPI001039B2F0|nr:phosphonate C-P lyase system protein PhnK [Rhizobium laguerreae]TBX99053.1 phosphonate C-P lyase system protein PhnK [Rhizobium laguerreae]
MSEALLQVRNVSKVFHGVTRACDDVSLHLKAGEVLGIVGESGSGKSTLLKCLGGMVKPDAGTIGFSMLGDRKRLDIWRLSESERFSALRTSLGFIHQNPRDGLRLDITAGGNIAEPLMSKGVDHYGELRDVALEWLERVEIDPRRVDDLAGTFSGGMQQRLQIARNLVLRPKCLLMDEPTGGLDVSVQARLLDLLRNIVWDLRIAVIIVTHDLAVARMLADRLIVMRHGRIIETGLTDQILDDPQQPYSQLLVSSALRV